MKLLPFGGHEVLLLELLSLVEFYEEFKALEIGIEGLSFKVAIEVKES